LEKRGVITRIIRLVSEFWPKEIVNDFNERFKDILKINYSLILKKSLENNGEEGLKNEILVLLKSANNLYNEQKYREAIRIYEAILEYDRDNISALEGMGSCYNDIGKYTKAIEYYEKAVNLDPKNAILWEYLGIAYENRGNSLRSKIKANEAFQKAKEAYQKSKDLNKN